MLLYFELRMISMSLAFCGNIWGRCVFPVLRHSGLCAAKPNNKKREKKGDVSSEVNPLTFHSLRHAAATWLRDALNALPALS